MPLNITAETPRASRTIAGLQLTVPQPYGEGHVCSAGEAQMLNQTLAENFSNNLRKRIEEFVPEGSPEGTAARIATVEEAQAIVDDYAGRYEPGVRQGGGGGGARGLTPLEREVRDLAKTKVADALKQKGMKRTDVNFNELVDGLIEKRRDQLEAAAKKVLAAKERASSASEDDDILDGIVSNTVASEPAASE